jgi:hypothetical protein
MEQTKCYMKLSVILRNKIVAFLITLLIPFTAYSDINKKIAIRYDGLYRFYFEKERNSDYLRFYEDGAVLLTNSTGDQYQVARWLNKDKRTIAKGKYKIEGSRIQFTVKSPYGTVKYEGIIQNKANSLKLNWLSLPSNNRGSIEYRFVKVDFPKKLKYHGAISKVQLETGRFSPVNVPHSFIQGLIVEKDPPFAISNDARYFVSFNSDGYLVVWETVKGKAILFSQIRISESNKAQFGNVRSIAIWSDLRTDKIRIAVDIFMESIRVFNERGKIITRIPNDREDVLNSYVTVSENIVVHCGSSYIRAYQYSNKTLKKIINVGETDIPSDTQGSFYKQEAGPCAISPNEKFIACGLSDSSIYLINVDTKKIVANPIIYFPKFNRQIVSSITDIHFNLNSTLVLVGQYQGQNVFQAKTGKREWVLHMVDGKSAFIDNKRLIFSSAANPKDVNDYSRNLSLIKLSKNDEPMKNIVGFEPDYVEEVSVSPLGYAILVTEASKSFLYKLKY